MNTPEFLEGWGIRIVLFALLVVLAVIKRHDLLWMIREFSKGFSGTGDRRRYFSLLPKGSPLLGGAGKEQTPMTPANLGKLVSPDSCVEVEIEEQDGVSLGFFVGKKQTVALSTSDIEQATARQPAVNGVWFNALLTKLVQYSVLPLIILVLFLVRQKPDTGGEIRSHSEVAVILCGGVLLLTGTLAFLSTVKYRKASWEYTLTLKGGQIHCFQGEKDLRETQVLKRFLNNK